MTAGTDALKRAWRNFVTDGIPATGPNEPDKVEIRAALDALALDIAVAAGGDIGPIVAVVQPLVDEAVEAAEDSEAALAAITILVANLPLVVKTSLDAFAVLGTRRDKVFHARATKIRHAMGWSVVGNTVDGSWSMYGPSGQLVLTCPETGAPTFAGAAGGSALVGAWSAGDGLRPIQTDDTKMAAWGSSTIDYMGASLTAMIAGLRTTGGATITFYAGGKASEKAEHMLARIGSHPALLTFPSNIIPASTTPVVLPLPKTGNSGLTWSTGASLLTFNVTVDGVPGTLSTTSGNPNSVTWTRTSAGDAVTTYADVPAVSAIGATYRNAVVLLNIGKNTLMDGPYTRQQMRQLVRECVNWISPLVKKVLVMDHFVDTNIDPTTDAAVYNRVVGHNRDLAEDYAPTGQLVRLFDFVGRGQSIYGQTVWQVTGLTPTSDDTAKQLQGRKPVQLSLGTGGSDAAHMSVACQNAVVTHLLRTQIITAPTAYYVIG